MRSDAVQFQTVQALFAIHKKVVRTRKWRHQNIKHAKHEEMVAGAFDEIDYDCSGTISKDEWESYVRRLELGIVVPERTVAAVFDAMDSADGNGTIDFDEFRTYLIEYAKSSDCIEEAVGAAVLHTLSNDDTVGDAERQLAKYVYAGIKKKEFRISLAPTNENIRTDGKNCNTREVLAPIQGVPSMDLQHTPKISEFSESIV